MSSLANAPARVTARRMLNKVPEVTVYFWLIKVLCTTVGETAADYLSTNLGWGANNTMLLTGSVLAVLLVTQFSLRRYVPTVYWATVVIISVFGTQITDKLTGDLGVSLTASTPIFAAILATVFAVWWGVERTLSIHTIQTTRREAFYWLAILFTFALGTAAGDLVAEKFTLGYAVSVAIFAGVIALIALAHLKLRMGAVLAFWLAYIMTRPLGASIGDFMSQNDPTAGGLALGTTTTSYVFLGLILALVTFLTVSQRDRTPLAQEEPVTDAALTGAPREAPDPAAPRSAAP